MVRRWKHTSYKKLKEFGLFSMKKRRYRENLAADFYFFMGDYSKDITSLLSEVYSKQTKATATRCNEVTQNQTTQQGWLNTRTGCPGRL